MQLTGTLYDAGEPLGDTTLSFRALETTSGGVVESTKYDRTTNEDGSYDFDLQPGNFSVYMGEKHLGRIYSTEGASKSLPEALEQGTSLGQGGNGSGIASDSDRLGGYLPSHYALASATFSGVYDDLSGKPSLGTVASHDTDEFATAEQGALADSALQEASLAPVATSGAYDDLTGRPSLFSGAYDDLTGKPSLFSGAYGDLTGRPTLGTAASTDASAYATAAQGDAADSAVQPDTLATVATTGSYTDLSDTPSHFSGSYNDLTDKPSLFSGDYGDLSNVPSFAPVATSGSYTDLTDKPAVFSGDYADLTNKPDIFSGNYSDLSGAPALSAVATSGNYADLNNAPSLFSGAYPDLTDKPTLGSAAATDVSDYATSAQGDTADSAVQPGDLASVATTGAYSDLSGTPPTPSVDNVEGLQSSLDAKADSQALTDLGINVDDLPIVDNYDFNSSHLSGFRAVVNTATATNVPNGVSTDTNAVVFHDGGGLQRVFSSDSGEFLRYSGGEWQRYATDSGASTSNLLFNTAFLSGENGLSQWDTKGYTPSTSWQEGYNALEFAAGNRVHLSQQVSPAALQDGKTLRFGANVSTSGDGVILTTLGGRTVLRSTDITEFTQDTDVAVNDPSAYQLTAGIDVAPRVNTYDLESGETPRYGHQSASDGQYLYVYGGRNSDDLDWYTADITLADFWRYDPNAGEWTQLEVSAEPGRRSGGSMVYADGYLYLIGGIISRDSDGNAGQLWRYDIANASWAQLANMPDSLFWHCAVTDGDIIYVSNGYSKNSNGNTTTWYTYSIADDSWSTMGTWTTRNNAGMWLYDGDIYVYGGYDSTHYVELYRISADSRDFTIDDFTSLADGIVGINTFAFTMDPDNGVLFTIGGSTDEGKTGRITSYVIAEDTWYDEGEVLPPRRFNEAAWVDGRVIGDGGLSDEGTIDQAIGITTYRGVASGSVVDIPADALANYGNDVTMDRPQLAPVDSFGIWSSGGPQTLDYQSLSNRPTLRTAASADADEFVQASEWEGAIPTRKITRTEFDNMTAEEREDTSVMYLVED